MTSDLPNDSDAPFIGLIDMLLAGSVKVEPRHLNIDRLQDIVRREFAKPGTVNINAIDPDDHRGVENPFDLDREEEDR